MPCLALPSLLSLLHQLLLQLPLPQLPLQIHLHMSQLLHMSLLLLVQMPVWQLKSGLRLSVPLYLTMDLTTFRRACTA